MCNTFNFRDYSWKRSDKQKQTSFFGFPLDPHSLPLKRKHKARRRQTAEVTLPQSSFQTVKETKQLISPLCPESNKPCELRECLTILKSGIFYQRIKRINLLRDERADSAFTMAAIMKGFKPFPVGKKKKKRPCFYFWGGRKASWKRRCPARPSQSKSRPADMWIFSACWYVFSDVFCFENKE